MNAKWDDSGAADLFLSLLTQERDRRLPIIEQQRRVTQLRTEVLEFVQEIHLRRLLKRDPP